MYPSPLASPTSRARSPPYSSSSQSSQTSPSGGMNRPLYTNPNMAFAATSKKYLGSTAGERRAYDTALDPQQQQRRRESMGSSTSPNSSGSVTPGPRSPGSPMFLPPIRPTEGFSHATPASAYSQQHKELGSGIVRPSTGMAMTRTSTRSPDYANQNGGIYPSLPPTHRSYDHPGSPYSSATSHYSSNPGSSPPSSTASPPPHSRSSHTSHGSHGHGAHPQGNGHTHGHSRHHSQQVHHSSSRSNGNAYATDYVSSQRLVPQRPSRRNTTDVSGGTGVIGPAAAGGIPPVLPRPPSVTGSAVSSGMLRREFRKHKTIMDDEEVASKLLNTYN